MKYAAYFGAGEICGYLNIAVVRASNMALRLCHVPRTYFSFSTLALHANHCQMLLFNKP